MNSGGLWAKLVPLSSNSNYRSVRYWLSCYHQAVGPFGEPQRHALSMASYVLDDTTISGFTRYLAEHALCRLIYAHGESAFWYLTTRDGRWHVLLASPRVRAALQKTLKRESWRTLLAVAKPEFQLA